MSNLIKRISQTLAMSVALSTAALPAFAEGDLTRQDPIVIDVEIGADDATKWVPNEFELETGKLYQFILKNSSEFKIDVDAPNLVSRIFTRKVQSYGVIDGEIQRTAEIKGNITEFEVFAGQQVDWWFVPLRTTRSPIKVCCTSEDDAVASMITIK